MGNHLTLIKGGKRETVERKKDGSVSTLGKKLSGEIRGQPGRFFRLSKRAREDGGKRKEKRGENEEEVAQFERC